MPKKKHKKKSETKKDKPEKKTPQKRLKKKGLFRKHAKKKQKDSEIPGLIVEHVKFKNQPAVATTPKHQHGPRVSKHTLSIPKRQAEKTKYLWGGVLLLASVIFVLWILNIRGVIRYTATQKQQIPGIWDNVQDDFAEVLKTIKQQEETSLDQSLDQTGGEKSLKKILDALYTELKKIGNTSTTPVTTNTVNSTEE